MLPVLKEMWCTSPSMKDLQTYIEANFTICKITEVRGIPQPYKPYSFYFPYNRNLPIQRGRRYIYYMLGGKKKKSYYFRIKAFKLENSYSPSCPLGKKDAVQLTSALRGCVAHKTFKSSCLFWVDIWDPGTQIIKLGLFSFILCQQQTVHSSVVAYIHM